MEKTLFNLFKERANDEREYKIHVLDEAEDEWEFYRGTLVEISKQMTYFEAQTTYVQSELHNTTIIAVIEA